MDPLRIKNHGPLVVATNYWGLPAAKAGKFYLSTNAGAFRLLVPRQHESILEADLVPAKEVVISRGPWPQARREDGLEVLFDDGSDNPFALHLSMEAVDRVPTPEDQGREWICTVWTAPRRGKPHLALQRPAWYRIVPRIPWLKPRLT